MTSLHTSFRTTPLAVLAAALLTAVGATAAEPTPQISALVRLLKADGKTVLAQAAVASGGTSMATLNVRAVDALVAANGRCAFNLRYDEVSNVALADTTNRFYANDTLVAQNTHIALKPGVLSQVTTQPYLYAGQNNVKIVLNADGANPVTGWVRINVDGTCTAAAAAAPTPAVVYIQPGSGDWNALVNAWGYSNYGVTQLRTKGYARYADLVKLNADLTAAVNAKKIERGAYQALMARWAVFTADADFKRLMAAVVPGTGGK